jgi:hypothetical protein
VACYYWQAGPLDETGITKEGSVVNIGEDFSNAEKGGYLILIIAGIGLVVYIGYEVYELGGSVCSAFCNLFGGLSSDCASSCSSSSSNGNTYGNALGQALSNPLGTIGAIFGGGGSNDSGSNGSTNADIDPSLSD